MTAWCELSAPSHLTPTISKRTAGDEYQRNGVKFRRSEQSHGGEGGEREERRVLSRARSSSPSPSSISSHLVLTTTAKLTSYQLYDNHISNMTAARATECSLAAVRGEEGARARDAAAPGRASGIRIPSHARHFACQPPPPPSEDK